jgi:hypothetical protein
MRLLEIVFCKSDAAKYSERKQSQSSDFKVRLEKNPSRRRDDPG